MFLKPNGNRQTVVQSQDNRKMVPFDLLCYVFFSFHHFPNSFVFDVLPPVLYSWQNVTQLVESVAD